MKLRRAGTDGVLVELGSLDEVLRLEAELRRRAPAGIVEIVPAARTVLLTGPGAAQLAAQLPSWDPPPLAPGAQLPIEIPVMYDGPDFEAVLEHAGLTPSELVALHTGTTLTVAFCGFAPGFAYLAGLPKRLHVPRRATPRTQVVEGAVGLAGEFTGVYPRASPGGWQIIGTALRPVWDERRDPPNLLAPGSTVRFVRA